MQRAVRESQPAGAGNISATPRPHDGISGFNRQLIPVFCGNQLFLLKTHNSQFSVSERWGVTTQARSETLWAQITAA